MGGKGKGGARAAYLPPARSRAPGADEGGPTITEKIKARKAAGGAEAWDEFKARVAKQQQEQHAIEHHDVLMSAQHRVMLDAERDARLRREAPPAKRKPGSGGSSPDSSSDESDESEGSTRKRRKKEHKHKQKHKHRHHDKESKRDRKHKRHKHKKKKRRRHGSSDSSSAEEGAGATSKASEPVALSAFMAAHSDSD
jgi:hypothetical protein